MFSLHLDEAEYLGRPRDGAMLQRILHAPIPASRSARAADEFLVYSESQTHLAISKQSDATLQPATDGST
jgi:hypothetical protein